MFSYWHQVRDGTVRRSEFRRLTAPIAEQQLRGGVIWRKTSGGSQSERGDHFVERLLTVVHSLRKQHRHVFQSPTPSSRCTHESPYSVGLTCS